jgi:hypothetical protein
LEITRSICFLGKYNTSDEFDIDELLIRLQLITLCLTKLTNIYWSLAGIKIMQRLSLDWRLQDPFASLVNIILVWEN